MKTCPIYLTIAINLLIQTKFFAQELRILIKGQVVNRSMEKISFANVVSMISGKGTFTNQDGLFSMEVENKDTIIFSAIGFKTEKVAALKLQYINNLVMLDSIVYQLKQVNILELKKLELKSRIMESKPTQMDQKVLVIPGLPDPNMELTPISPNLVQNPISALYEIFKKESRRKRKQARWNQIYLKNLEKTGEQIPDTLYMPPP